MRNCFMTGKIQINTSSLNAGFTGFVLKYYFED